MAVALDTKLGLILVETSFSVIIKLDTYTHLQL